MDSLFPFRLYACYKERLKLRCPYGTVIMMHSAQYGRSEPSTDICPAVISVWSNGPLATPTPDTIDEDTNCNASTSMQVRILIHSLCFQCVFDTVWSCWRLRVFFQLANPKYWFLPFSVVIYNSIICMVENNTVETLLPTHWSNHRLVPSCWYHESKD